MTDSTLLPLRPAPNKNDRTPSLKDRITQINQQKGAFRFVSEALLIEEIAVGCHLGNDDNATGIDEDEKCDDRQAVLQKGRDEMLRQIE